MAAYHAAPDLLAVTRRVGSLQLERSVLATSAQSYAARAHADEVERELLMLENALDTVAMMLGEGLGETDDSEDSEDSEDESAAATPLPRGVRRELERHMSRVQKLAGERDMLEAAIAAAPAGDAQPSSQRRLEAVEAELSELERTLDQLARELGGEDGPLAWALSKRAGEGDAAGASNAEGTSNFTDSDDSDEWLAARVRSTRSSVPAQADTSASPARRAGGVYARRVGGRNAAVGRRAPPQNAMTKRAEARGHTRALLEGGLGHAMKGVRPSR